MAKDKVFIHRYWKSEFFDPIAVSASLDEATEVAIKTEIAKEVEWVVRNPDFEADTMIRLTKIDDLLNAHEGVISDFDQYSTYRKMFFEWVLV